MVVSCRLASGDSEGRVVIWDVHSASVFATLEDPWQAALGTAKKSEQGKSGSIKDLAWVMSAPSMLAIVTSSGLFLIWDVKG